MHKRKIIKLRERKIRGIILKNSFSDKRQGEIVCKITKKDVLTELNDPEGHYLVPELETGEILFDLKARGSFQRGFGVSK